MVRLDEEGVDEGERWLEVECRAPFCLDVRMIVIGRERDGVRMIDDGEDGLGRVDCRCRDHSEEDLDLMGWIRIELGQRTMREGYSQGRKDDGRGESTVVKGQGVTGSVGSDDEQDEEVSVVVVGTPL